MIDIFQISSNDQSCAYLVSIFGDMNGIVCNSPTGATNAVLSAMFQAFNSVILAVAALMLVYITVVGVMQTAHEGEFMGKKWNNIWLPIRTVLGIAALVPLGSAGYSLIQYVMMWFIVQGIGAADVLLNKALAALQSQGGLFAQPSVSQGSATSNISLLFQGLVCDATARLKSANPSNTSNSGYYCQGSNDSFCTNSTATFPGNASCNGGTCSFPLGPGGNCGALSYCNPTDSSNCGSSSSLKCVACQAQYTALSTIIPTLSNIASDAAQADYNYRMFKNNSYDSVQAQPYTANWQFIYQYCTNQGITQANCCVPNPAAQSFPPGGGTLTTLCPAAKDNFPAEDASSNLTQSPSADAVKQIFAPYLMQKYKVGTSSDFITTNITEYTTQVNTQVNQWIKTQNQGYSATIQNIIDKNAADGWIMAGGLYYALSGTNTANLQDGNPTLSMNAQDPSQTLLNGYRNNYAAASVLIAKVTNMASSGMAANPQLSSTSSAISSTMGGVGQSFTSNIAGQTNPLLQLQASGMAMLIAAEIFYGVLLGLMTLAGLAGNIDVWVLGNAVLDPIGPTMLLVSFYIIPMVVGLLGMLISMGGLLGVYVPLIPYIIFTIGAISWLLAVFETMVAGPLVALGIISPSGEHELLGKAQPAIMLLFNVFLRPTLMIFGLMAAMFLATVVVNMINYTFWTTVFVGIFSPAATTNTAAAAVSAAANPLEFCLFLGAYVALIVAALNKCFAAITVIPTSVMQWISGHGAPGGEVSAAEALSGAKEGVSGAGAGAKGAMVGSGEATKGALQLERKGTHARKEAEIGKGKGLGS